MKKQLQKRKKNKKENEKVANRKLGKVGNLGNVIPSFLISAFSILPTAKIENSDLKISEKTYEISEVSDFSTWSFR